MNPEWQAVLGDVLQSQRYRDLIDSVHHAYTHTTVYPPQHQIFNALSMTPFSKVKVVIVGQDPYHQPHQAMGLSFSVNPGVALPKSLSNIYRELYDDLKITRIDGDLSAWAHQGVLLLNTILTVEHARPLSHQDLGWEWFTAALIQALNKRKDPVIFVLWGKHAQQFATGLEARHPVIMGPHPSPLSAYRGFFGSKPFSSINNLLEAMNKSTIDWR